MKLAEMDRLDRHPEVEPENPVVETEKGDSVTRLTYKNGDSGWTSTRIHLFEHDQDELEEAYEMGMKAAGANTQKAYSLGYGKGAYDSAKTAYGGKR